MRVGRYPQSRRERTAFETDIPVYFARANSRRETVNEQGDQRPADEHFPKGADISGYFRSSMP